MSVTNKMYDLLGCPKCGHRRINILFEKKQKEFTCNYCKSKLRLVGYWWFVILPPIITTLIFPYSFLKNTSLMLASLFLLFLAISVVILLLFVRIQLIPENSNN